MMRQQDVEIALKVFEGGLTIILAIGVVAAVASIWDLARGRRGKHDDKAR